MTAEQFDDLKKWFESYVDDITPDDDKLRILIDLKRAHSCEVAANCRDIAEAENLPSYDVLTAEMLGLIHDIGRFSQLVEYQTFSDSDSINHGELGYEIVRDSNILSGVSEVDEERILNGIRYHNSRTIPGGLSFCVMPFVQLIRDADKLDIYRVISETLRNKDYDKYPEITLHIDFDGPVNPSVIDQIRDGGTVSYGNIKSLADFRITQLSWLYDINYTSTLSRIVERGLLAEVVESLPDDEDVNEIVRAVSDFIDSKMKSIVN